MKEGYRYSFGKCVELDDVEASLVLAILSVEGLRGESEVRLDVQHLFDRELRACLVDASTDAGVDLNRIFVGFLRREFGENAFTVERIETAAATGTVAVAA